MMLLLRSYLLLLSLYHLWTGSISYLSPRLAMKFYRGMYACDPVEQRHLAIILRPWGALAVFAGISGLVAFFDPSHHSALTGGLALLLVLRIGYRIALRHELHAISGIPPSRNWISIACLIAGAAMLGIGAFVARRG